MTIYSIYAEIKTNAEPENLYYDMEVYKETPLGTKIYALRPTGKQPLQADKKTQVHQSMDIIEVEESSYITSIDIYRKVNSQYIQVTTDPLTTITPLKGFQTKDKDWGPSRDINCYFETVQKTQPSQNGQVNTYNLKISRPERHFNAAEHPEGDALDPFTKTNMQQELQARLAKSTFPDQGGSSLCGPASFFYALLIDRPDIYRQVVNELWESGKTKIGSLKLKPGTDCKNPTKFFRYNTYSKQDVPKISAIDWMTLASLRDTENSFLDYDSPDDQLSGITMGGAIKSWFEKAGATKKHTTSFSYVFGSNLKVKDVCTLNGYIDGDNHIVVLIGAGMLNGGSGSSKNHWIVWKDKLKLVDGSEITEQTALTEKVSLELFSWGSVGNQLKKDLTLGDALDHLYGGLVFSKIP